MKIRKKQNIKSRLFNYILYLIIIMTTLTLFSVLNTHAVKNEYKNMVRKLILLNDLSQGITDTGEKFEKYFTLKLMEDMEKFYDSYKKVEACIDAVKPLIKDSDGLKAIRDIENLITGFKDESYKAFESSQTFNSNSFYIHYVEAKNIEKYTESHIRLLIKQQLSISDDIYQKLNSQASTTEAIIIIAIILISIFVLTYSSRFFQDLTEPIIKLSNISRELANGNFDVEKVSVKTDDELKQLADGFNSMVENIKDLIQKIEDNAKFREKLKDEEMKNLFISKALKDEQLKALQAQINPHFLFNTLNAIVNTATVEDAHDTEKLIQSLSDILRYSLRKSINPATIKEEIYIINQYMLIQKTRFQSRLNFILENDESLSKYSIPTLTLQPLVENAFIHGIEGKEGGGTIKVTFKDMDNKIFIQITDNGYGIHEEKLKTLNLFEEPNSTDIKRGHVTGLGLNNVVQRLKIYFKNDVEFSIESIYGKGTDIFIKIPKVLEDENV